MKFFSIFCKSLKVLALTSMLSASFATKAIDCGPYKVVIIQAQQGDVLMQVSSGGVTTWKSLGQWSAPATRPYLAITQQALAMDRSIFLRYADPYTCASTDYFTQPQMVRLDSTM
jgi:hypothetical protein